MLQKLRIPLLALATMCAVPAQAADYPTRPIRLLIPYSPGGPVDISGRIVALKLTETFGQQVIVDNRAGGGGNIAVEIVAKSAPDGYTLLMGANGTNAINPSLYPKLAVDPAKELAPLGLVASSPMILVAHPSLPAANVKELVALAKAKPGTINFASSGSGSTAHLSSELLKLMSGVQIVHVPYKGASPALTDLVAGQTQFMFTGVSSTLPFVKSGKLKALGVSSDKRLAILPEVPTVAEAVPGYEVVTWYGVFAPVATPKAITEKLTAALSKIVASADARERFAALGAEANFLPPDKFAAMVRVETAKWAKVIKESGAKPE